MSKNEIDYVRNLSKSSNCIIEFGSGLSTLIWEQNFGHVISVETRRDWYLKISKSLKKTNTTYIFSPPESIAFGENGDELWNTRSPSDYGTVPEFSRYFQTAKRLIESAPPTTTFFVDGNLRKEISMWILENRSDVNVLLHDVIAEREYLNEWRLSPELNLKITQIDSLVHLFK
jgi:hypothetical protein